MKRSITIFLTMMLCLLFLLLNNTYSQSSKIHFGIRAGINFQSFLGEDQYGINLNNKSILTYNGGLNVEIPIISDFYVQSGILFTIKGSQIKVDSVETKIPKIFYLEVPLNILYKHICGKGHLIIGLGPYFAFGLGGNSKYEETLGGHTAEINFQNSITATAPLHVDYFRPLDLGTNFLVGYEFSNKFSILINAQLGLIKINPSDDRVFPDYSSTKNAGFGISFGYLF